MDGAGSKLRVDAEFHQQVWLGGVQSGVRAA